MKKTPYDEAQVTELLYQALETEVGGVQIYESAIPCATNENLKREWTEYLNETHHHREVLLGVFEELGLDPDTETRGRAVVRHIGESLVIAIGMALRSSNAAQAQLVASECVVLAESQDHMNWSLIGHIAEHGKGPAIGLLKTAFDEVKGEEDHHFSHAVDWTRELWIEALGLPAVLPPAEGTRKVGTISRASRHSRDRIV